MLATHTCYDISWNLLSILSGTALGQESWQALPTLPWSKVVCLDTFNIEGQNMDVVQEIWCSWLLR